MKNDLKKRAIELKVKGLTYKQIGEELGVSAQQVHTWNSPAPLERISTIKAAKEECEKCGKGKSTKSFRGVIHHVTYGEKAKLQYLCSGCHARTHAELNQEKRPDPSPVLKAIQAEVTKPGSSMRAVAREKGLNHSYLHDVINGRRDVSLRVGAAFGFEWSDKGWKRVKEVAK